jgi:hypothetical protein
MRQIFILEGALTAAVAIPIIFILADFPKDAKFLSEEDKQYIQDRLIDDAGIGPVRQAPLSFKLVLEVLNDHRLWILSVILLKYV